MSITENLEELKPLELWVNYVRLWNPTRNGGRGGYDKPPINPHTLRDAMTNNPATWTDYATAAANIGKTASHRDIKHKDDHGNAPIVTAEIEGVGLILARGYCGIDLDNVIDENGQLAPFAAAIVERLDTYTEVSPSGRGLHLILFCGDLLERAKAKEVEAYRKALNEGVAKEDAIARAKGRGDLSGQFVLNAAGEITDDAGKVYEVEIYFYLRGNRYFTVTGNPYLDKPINRTKDNEFLAVLAEYTKKRNAHRAAQRPASSVGSHNVTRPATGDQDRKMVESALSAIIPSELNFGEWASIMTELKYEGFPLDYAEHWSSGGLCLQPNPKNDPATNAYRWNKFHFQDGQSNPGIIINMAKHFNWTPADAFDSDARAAYGRSLYSDEARTAYGRSLYSDEQRRQYGRDKHEQRMKAFEERHADDFKKWKERRKNSQTGTAAHEGISLENFNNWKKDRKKD